ncbi:hypothetical protein [Ornithinimicrobium kibberense]|uniref:hypothetical protein n=1 Tax=Ornithinimicrobium kibberense TaxID=282060 RepID=UPI00361669AD
MDRGRGLRRGGSGGLVDQDPTVVRVGDRTVVAAGGSGGPEETGAGEDVDDAQAGDEGGQAQGQLEGGGGHGAHAELADEAVDGAGPDVTAGGGVGRVGAVEVAPVLAAVGVLDGPALGGDRVGDLQGLVADLQLGEGVALGVDELVLGEGDLGGAVDDVVHDGGHLEHVLAGGVDQRVVGVHLHAGDGVAPLVLEHGHDGVGLLRGAPVHQLTVLVVGQLDALDLAEALQGVPAVLVHLEGDAGADEEDQAEDHEHDPDETKTLCHAEEPPPGRGPGS